MKVRTQVLLWGAQRYTAMVLVFCVVVHLITIVYATRYGLTAAQILDRTQGNLGWAAFYALFVAAVAVHAAIGMRAILSELLDWRGAALDALLVCGAVGLALWGWRAVWGVFA